MATITEDYCSREIYRLLIEKGFDGEVHTTFDEEGYTQPSITLQMAMKWLREVYDFNIEIDTIGRKDKETLRWRSIIYNLNNQCDCYYNENCDSYEQASELAIRYCLKNLI